MRSFSNNLEFGFNVFFSVVFVAFVAVGLVQGRVHLTLRSSIAYGERPTVFLALWSLYTAVACVYIWQVAVFVRP